MTGGLEAVQRELEASERWSPGRGGV